MSNNADISAGRGLIGSSWSTIWTIVLGALAIGATTNLLLFTDVVQPYCAMTPSDDGELCRPCGLRGEMFGMISPTQCPNSVVDDLLWIFVGIPRDLMIVAGIAWFVTVPTLVANFLILVGRRRRRAQTMLETLQLGLLAYILLWAAAVAVFFIFPR